MMAFTHAAAGAATSILVAEYLHADNIHSLLILSGGIAGSYLPDIDHPRSAFGRRVLPLSLPISAIFGHRGITHSLIAVVAMSGFMWWGFQKVKWDQDISIPVLIGMAAGYLSHLLGDWMSNSGIPLLWPSKRRFVSPLKICTGDFIEYILAILMYGWVGMMVMKRLS